MKEKVSFKIWLAMKIARTMLLIKATTFKKLNEEPYKWACGMLMRIYNDNRMMLGNYMHRMRITKGFVHLIKERGINPDFIIGTMTSGVAPATSVAQFLGKKLLVHDGEKYLCYSHELCNRTLLRNMWQEDFNLIISISAATIPYGVQYANALGKGFAYGRKAAKDHGKGQLIEGIIRPGDKFILIYEIGQEYHNFMNTIAYGYGATCITAFPIDPALEILREVPYESTAVVIEDLFSTGGSAAFEVHKARMAGIICDYCFSIFSYGFDCLKKQFYGETNISNKTFKLAESCEIDSLLPFSILMKEIKKMKFYPKETIRAMEAEIGTFDQRYEEFLEEKDKIG